MEFFHLFCSIFVLIHALRLSDYGCHLRGEYVGCIVYADDILLLSASVTNLQKMLNICCEQADIQFNPKKSCLFNVGKGYKDCIQNLFIKDKEVVWLSLIHI